MINRILGIESSCDETAAAVVADGRHMLSSIVSSQIAIHRKYGGVVPEIASRKHIESIIAIVDEALSQAGVSLSGIDAVAATQGPGLMGSLIVGLSTAKAIAFSIDRPLISVDHLEAHTSAVHLENNVNFPFISLIVSGGHTNLYYVTSHTDFELIGKTRDDAAGEAFDKAANILGLGYPGGVEIDRLSKEGDPASVKFPRPFLEHKSYDFSYSGLKTSLLYHIRDNPVRDCKHLSDICASYQEAIVETLTRKTLAAAKDYNVGSVVISGGVACNSRLREVSRALFPDEGMEVFIPSPKLCTDNAAMIASLGYYRLKKGLTAEMDTASYSTARSSHIS